MRLTAYRLEADEEHGDGWELRRVRISALRDKWCVMVRTEILTGVFVAADLSTSVCLVADSMAYDTKEEAEIVMLKWLIKTAGEG